ncbi:PH domain-containing protein [Nocardioides sp. 503]|uniref:PH domain-containing protein n=1 Tax=Nocardioides sp. 503 TaxID=2508326 RepID=UPI00106FE63C|nr:PH domain-containing protein [Nocardioides sp. 503]
MVISQKLLNPGERIVVSTRTHPKALLVPLLALVVLLAAGVAFQVLVDNSTARLVVWAIAVIGILWFVVWPTLDWMMASYTITNRRLITRHGIITRKGHDIPLSRISDVAYELGLIDRMLGCGTLVISDASTHGQVLLPDIPRVEDTQRRLNELLHELHGGAANLEEGH